MRPFVFYLVGAALAGPLAAQDPVYLALRMEGMVEDVVQADGYGWIFFSKQQFGISDWNASGAGIYLSRGSSTSAVLVSRDGIPSFAEWGLHLSHSFRTSRFALLVQLRFSLLETAGRAPAFRCGGNLQTLIRPDPKTEILLTLLDAPGWLFPSGPVVCGRPAIGIGLSRAAADRFRIGIHCLASRAAPAGWSALIGYRPAGPVSLFGVIGLSPPGISIGMNWNGRSVRVRGMAVAMKAPGITPFLEVGSHKSFKR